LVAFPRPHLHTKLARKGRTCDSAGATRSGLSRFGTGGIDVRACWNDRLSASPLLSGPIILAVAESERLLEHLRRSPVLFQDYLRGAALYDYPSGTVVISLPRYYGFYELSFPMSVNGTYQFGITNSWGVSSVFQTYDNVAHLLPPPPDEEHFLTTSFGFLIIGLYFLGRIVRGSSGTTPAAR